MPEAPKADVANETARVEAFSDGVFAIAITLLIIEVHVPRGVEPGQLASALHHLWPALLAYATSFVTIGVMWMNHHRLFNLIGTTTQSLLVANTLLLLGVAFVPFPTALLAEYLFHPDARLAAVVYNGTFFVLAIFFQILWRYSAKHVLAAEVDRADVAAITRQYAFGPFVYLALTGIALVSPLVSLILNLVVALFFAIPASWFKKA